MIKAESKKEYLLHPKLTPCFCLKCGGTWTEYRYSNGTIVAIGKTPEKRK